MKRFSKQYFLSKKNHQKFIKHMFLYKGEIKKVVEKFLPSLTSLFKEIRIFRNKRHKTKDKVST